MRPNTLPGLLLALARLTLARHGRALLPGAVLAAAFLASAWLVTCQPTLRVATFNIEFFPKDDRQVQGAFDLLTELAPEVVALQEITDPPALERTARERLGDSWRFVHAGRKARLKLGVLYDADRMRLDWSRAHTELELHREARPALEVRLLPLDGDRPLRVIVVHLKSGSADLPVRLRQLDALAPIARRAVDSGDRVVLMGDFNATSPEDRSRLEAMAADTGMTWATAPLPCTSYWARRDGCLGSALDHILTTETPRRVAARGPCQTEGCQPGDRCPIFHREVSDHCPVTADLHP